MSETRAKQMWRRKVDQAWVRGFDTGKREGRIGGLKDGARRVLAAWRASDGAD